MSTGCFSSSVVNHFGGQCLFQFEISMMITANLSLTNSCASLHQIQWRALGGSSALCCRTHMSCRHLPSCYFHRCENWRTTGRSIEDTRSSPRSLDNGSLRHVTFFSSWDLMLHGMLISAEWRGTTRLVHGCEVRGNFCALSAFCQCRTRGGNVSSAI